MRELTPKNGRFLVCLIIGGPADRAREIREILAKRRGILVRYHWDYDRPRSFQRKIPKDVDFAIILKSMLGHSDEANAREQLRKADVPFTRSPHKWSNLSINLLKTFSIYKSPALPVGITSTAFFQEEPDVAPAPEPAKVLQIAPSPAPELRIEPVRDAPVYVFPKLSRPRPETLAAIIQLQRMLAEDGIDTVMMSPKEVSISTPRLLEVAAQ